MQYLDDAQARTAFVQFKLVLKDGGTLILHVKNSSSLGFVNVTGCKEAKTTIREADEN